MFLRLISKSFPSILSRRYFKFHWRWLYILSDCIIYMGQGIWHYNIIRRLRRTRWSLMESFQVRGTMLHDVIRYGYTHYYLGHIRPGADSAATLPSTATTPAQPPKHFSTVYIGWMVSHFHIQNRHNAVAFPQRQSHPNAKHAAEQAVNRRWRAKPRRARRVSGAVVRHFMPMTRAADNW